MPGSIFRPSATAAMNCVCTLSIICWKMVRSSSVNGRTGEPMSLYAPAFSTSAWTPIFCSSSWTLPNSMITPIEPVSDPGLATIASHALAT